MKQFVNALVKGFKFEVSEIGKKTRRFSRLPKNVVKAVDKGGKNIREISAQLGDQNEKTTSNKKTLKRFPFSRNIK